MSKSDYFLLVSNMYVAGSDMPSFVKTMFALGCLITGIWCDYKGV